MKRKGIAFGISIVMVLSLLLFSACDNVAGRDGFINAKRSFGVKGNSILYNIFKKNNLETAIDFNLKSLPIYGQNMPVSLSYAGAVGQGDNGNVAKFHMAVKMMDETIGIDAVGRDGISYMKFGELSSKYIKGESIQSAMDMPTFDFASSVEMGVQLKNILTKIPGFINNSLPEEGFVDGTKTLSINGKDTKVKSISFALNGEALEKLLKDVVDAATSDAETFDFLKNCLSATGIDLSEEAIASFKESISLDGNPELIWERYFLNNAFIGEDLSVKLDNSENEVKMSYLIDSNKEQDSVTALLSVKFGENTMTGDFTYTENRNDNKGVLSFSIQGGSGDQTVKFAYVDNITYVSDSEIDEDIQITVSQSDMDMLTMNMAAKTVGVSDDEVKATADAALTVSGLVFEFDMGMSLKGVDKIDVQVPSDEECIDLNSVEEVNAFYMELFDNFRQQCPNLFSMISTSMMDEPSELF